MARGFAIFLALVAAAQLSAFAATSCGGNPLALYDTVGQSLEKNPNGEPKEYYSIVSIARIESSQNNALLGWMYLDDHGFLTAQLNASADARVHSWFVAKGEANTGLATLYHVGRPIPDWLKLAPCDLSAR